MNFDKNLILLIGPSGELSTPPVNHFTVDPTDQSWPSFHNVHNRLHRDNSYPMITSFKTQYDHTIPAIDQPQQIVLEERLSKRVKFAQPLQQTVASKSPLTHTQSWSESTATTNDTSMSTTQQEILSNKLDTHRLGASVRNTSLNQAARGKPIYITIDHQATLAERDQRKAQKLHRRTRDKNNVGELHSNQNTHRTASHTRHQKKQHQLIDSSTSHNNVQSNNLSESSKVKLLNALMTTSTLTMPTNQQMKVAQQPTWSPNRVKSSKAKVDHHSSSRKLLLDKERKGNHPPQKQSQHNTSDSLLHSKTTQRAKVQHHTRTKKTITTETDGKVFHND